MSYDIKKIKSLDIDYSVSHKCLYGEHSICGGKFDYKDGMETCECPCHSNGGIHYKKLDRDFKKGTYVFFCMVAFLLLGIIIGIGLK